MEDATLIDRVFFEFDAGLFFFDLKVEEISSERKDVDVCHSSASKVTSYFMANF